MNNHCNKKNGGIEKTNINETKRNERKKNK